MFADTQIIGVLFLFYFFYAFYDVIKSFFSGFKPVHQGVTHKKDRKLTQEMIQEAMKNRTFGSFSLTPAVVFFKDGDVIPSEGYKIEKQVMPNGRVHSRMLVSASAEDLLDIFDDFIALLGESCSVVVEDFRTTAGDHVDYFAYYKETFIVRSILLDFDELLLNDGFIGLAIWSEATQAEVQLNMHKVIQVFARDIVPFQQVLAGYGIQEDPKLRFFFEDFYMLVSTQAGDSAVEALKDRLCIDHSAVQQGGFEAMAN
jgi:hypothetical protein